MKSNMTNPLHIKYVQSKLTIDQFVFSICTRCWNAEEILFIIEPFSCSPSCFAKEKYSYSLWNCLRYKQL